MPPLTLLIKPASSGCNMRCQYCFYLDTAQNRTIASYGIMKLSTLENIIGKALSAASQQCIFAFQGGEPTLAGLDFYKTFIELVNRYNSKRLEVRYSIQTNGYDIGREWAVFLAKHHFLVGISLDGTKDIHDLYRLDTTGNGTFAKVMRTAQLFDHYGVEYNILTTVTAQAVKNIGKIYGFFRRNHFMYQQYIPCLDPLFEERNRHKYSLTPELYGKFLCNLFDLWHNDFIRGKPVSVRYFDNLIQMLMGYPPESCGMAGECSRQIVIEADGSVYTCDFYVLDQYRLGNLNIDDFQAIEKKRDSLGFIDISRQIPLQCGECRWYPLCRGGCRRDREPVADLKLSVNYFCLSYKQFFEYAYPRLEHCAQYARPTATEQNILRCP